MSAHWNRSFWSVLAPTAWPDALLWMSFSTLMELERCPRRWALSAAQYPDIWDKRGYPRPLQPAALEGTVVHLSLQKVASALVKRGCPSLSHESAVATLRELGGYTAVVLSSLEQALQSYEGNPRAALVLDGIRHRLTTRVPELRARVQRFLARIHPESRTDLSKMAVSHPTDESRRKLLHGSYAEVQLRADQLGWHGIADLLTISNEACEIREFKTGVSAQEHQFQLHIYALLWARDRDLNPNGRLATKLVLSYGEGDAELPAPGAEELCRLEDELQRRTAQVLADLQVAPPEARASQENCAYCPVRQLCEEYWPWYAQQYSSNESPRTGVMDVQIKLSGQHGPRSWDGVVESGPGLRIGGSILLRTANFPFDLHPGQRVRLLNVQKNVSEEEPIEEQRSDPPVVVTMCASSEAFLVP